MKFELITTINYVMTFSKSNERLIQFVYLNWEQCIIVFDTMTYGRSIEMFLHSSLMVWGGAVIRYRVTSSLNYS